MVRPVAFRMNEQTAVNNYFQEGLQLSNEEINKQAQQEFDAFVGKLRAVGVKIPFFLITGSPSTKMALPPFIPFLQKTEGGKGGQRFLKKSKRKVI